MKSQTKTALLAALLSLNIAALGLAAGSSIYLLKKGIPAQAAENSTAESSAAEEPEDESSEDPEEPDDPSEEEEGEFEEHAHAENDVVIGGHYRIRSTEQISDAYKAGDPSSLSAADKETYDMASKLLSEIITNDMSDYAKEKAVYDWMTSNLSFDDGMLTVISSAGAEVDHPHGVLRSRKAVCVGFATTFRLLMQMMNIDCKVVHDTYLSHSWDCVKIGEHWYFVDIYGDIGAGNYAHFNLTSALFSVDHDWDKEYFPVADSLEYNPAYHDRVKAEDVYGVPQLVRNAMDEKRGMLCIEFESAKLEDNEIGIIDNIFDALQYSGDALYNERDRSVPQNHCVFEDPDTGRNMLFVSFYLEHDNPAQRYELTEEEAEKANAALSEAFGDLGYFSVDNYGG